MQSKNRYEKKKSVSDLKKISYMEIDHPIDLLRHEINFRMSEIYGKTAMKEMYASHLKAEKR